MKNSASRASATGLLTSQRFGPFFATLFLGALNDNLFKNTLVLIFVFQAAAGGEVDKLTNLAAGLFILPYLLFSALAGQLADRFEKSSLIRLLKLFELGLMLLAAQALLSHNLALLFVLLFLMATQSAFFSPIKFSLIPQHLERWQWVAGNGLVEAGTFAAILMGTLLAGVLYRLPNGELVIAVVLCAQALLGWIACRRIPLAPSVRSDLTLNYNPLSLSLELLGHCWRDRRLRFLILCISWFWFLGASYLTQVPHYAQAVLGGDPLVVSWLLCCFTLGIGGGSIACNRLTRDRLGRDMVVIGILGLILAGADLYWASPANPQPAGTLFTTVMSANIRVSVDIILIGAFAGFYIVPLYTQLQAYTRADNRARAMAANNIVNAVMMVLSAAAGFVLLGIHHWPLTDFFLTLALSNTLLLLYLLRRRPAWALASLLRVFPGLAR